MRFSTPERDTKTLSEAKFGHFPLKVKSQKKQIKLGGEGVKFPHLRPDISCQNPKYQVVTDILFSLEDKKSVVSPGYC